VSAERDFWTPENDGEVPKFIMGRRFAHYRASCGVKPFSIKTVGRPQFNSNKSSRHAVGFCVHFCTNEHKHTVIFDLYLCKLF
jgi:hypothetical protein